MNEKKVIKDYGSRAVRQSWNSFFVAAKIDMFHWQALSELIANTILKNSSGIIIKEIRKILIAFFFKLRSKLLKMLIIFLIIYYKFLKVF